MRIILEGPDNAGKSTLAAAIQGSAMYHHPGGKPEDWPAELKCMVDQLEMVKTNSNVVIDRVTSISQTIYNPHPGRQEDRNKYLKDMMMLGAVVIYCRPSDDQLMAFQDFTWRDGETEEHKQKIITGQHEFIRRYDRLMLNVPHISYDFTNEHSAAFITKHAYLGLQGDAKAEQWFHNLIAFRGGQ